MNGELTLAKRYATAYLDLYDDQLDLTTVEHCERAADFIVDTPQALLLIKLSIIPDERKRECLAALFAQFKLPLSLIRLVDLLNEHTRLSLLPKILYQIAELFRVRHGIMVYQVISAEKLDEQAVATIVAFLGELSGKKIIATEKIDQSLIAGIRLLSDSTLWEYSIQKQLNQLQHQFNV